MLRRRGFTMVELIVVIGLGVILLSAIPSCMRAPRETACRAKCSNNLRQIGLAITMYCQENKGQYPRTLSDNSLPLKLDNGGCDDANPFAEPGLTDIGANNVTASLFLLIRTQGISTDVFTCPTSSQSKDTMGGLDAGKRSNFSHLAQNLSYGYATPFSLGVAKYGLTKDLSSDFAIAADRGPGKSAATVTSASDPTQRQKLANSPNHSREGQNILYADAHVSWERTPLVGIDQNNIYLGDSASPGNRRLRVYANTADAKSQKPASPEDSVIVPWEQEN